MRPFSFIVSAATSAAVAGFLFIGIPATRSAAVAATPPPTPPPIAAPATPLPDGSLAPGPAATLTPVKPTPSPPPNARKGVDGVWEVQIQHPNFTDYTHFALTQQGDALTGTYIDVHGKKYPLSGTIDGQAVRLIVTMPNGTTLLAEGKLDGTTDMIGVLTMPSGQLPFTASYRAKEKWIENLNATPGGIPNSGGGYTPP